MREKLCADVIFFLKRRHIGQIRKDKGDKNRSSKLQNNMCSSIPINWNI